MVFGIKGKGKGSSSPWRLGPIADPASVARKRRKRPKEFSHELYRSASVAASWVRTLTAARALPASAAAQEIRGLRRRARNLRLRGMCGCQRPKKFKKSDGVLAMSARVLAEYICGSPCETDRGQKFDYIIVVHHYYFIKIYTKYVPHCINYADMQLPARRLKNGI